jgi:rsbT co-antagonist protein RsbR
MKTLELKDIGTKIINESENLAERVGLDNNRSQAGGREVNKEEVFKVRTEFYKLAGSAFLTDDKDVISKEVYDWGKKVGLFAVTAGITADQAMLVIPAYRRTLFDFIEEQFEKEGADFKIYADIAEIVNPVFDRAVYAFTQAYVEYNEETYRKTKEELFELSVPIVPLTDNVAILPLIGTIDTYRSKQLLETTLEKGTALGLDYLIIDLSGVHMIDTAVAHNLFQLNDALKLVGITAIFAGLRPELSQTMVNLGISFKNMVIVHSLAKALPIAGLRIDSKDNDVYAKYFKQGKEEGKNKEKE